jgi:N6-L-threonylcarbamoyladenine synthase
VGGVACNSLLRKTFKEAFEGGDSRQKIRVYYPSSILTTDNAAMIAAAGTPKFRDAAEPDLQLNAYADLRLC